MKLPSREILAFLERPLRIAENFGLNLQGRFSRPSAGESHDGHFKPSPKNHSSITSNPLIPAFLLLTFGFTFLTSGPVTAWLTSSNDLPTLAQIFKFAHKKPYTLPKAGEGVSVWTKQQSGFYYCAGGALFGNKPGEMVTQTQALMTGYRPADGKYCQSVQPVVASADVPPDASPSPAGSASLANDTVGVWAMKDEGLYYCRGEILFGSKPGKLMTQSDAQTAGYLPFGGACTNGQSNQASAGNQAIAADLPTGEPDFTTVASQPVDAGSTAAPAVAKGGQRVSVWVKKSLGFYYCKNDVLFGSEPGQLMTQTDALAAGYQGSDGLCATGKTTRASAEVLSSRAYRGPK